MNRYLDSDTVLHTLCEGFDRTSVPKAYPGVKQTIEAWLDEIPAADVAPVRRGRWVATDRVGMVSGWKCSVCDAPCMRSSFNKVARSPYCPNCGAKMETGV